MRDLRQGDPSGVPAHQDMQSGMCRRITAPTVSGDKKTAQAEKTAGGRFGRYSQTQPLIEQNTWAGNTAHVPVWFCMEGSRRLLLSLENHINLYARARASVGLVKA